jgi:taurine dioxygenase
MPDTATLPGQEAFTVTPISSAAGAEISGLDLSKAIGDETAEALREAWHEHMVLLVRGQDLTADDQERFCRVFGELAGLKSKKSTSKFLWVSNREVPDNATAVQLGEMMFHYDQSYAENPCKASTLYSLEIPDVGGNTCFANCCLAYDALSDEWKQRIDGLTALNYFNYDTNPSSRPGEIDPTAPQTSHPVVRTHAETGRKSIYANRLMTMQINGVEKAESDEILSFLFDHIEKPEHIYEHVWEVGDLVLWDNRCLAHARTDYDPTKKRLLRRMTILDENPVS